MTAGYIEGELCAGMVVDFEPIVSIGGQGYYLEDMYLINKTGTELLTPGVPYTAEDRDVPCAKVIIRTWAISPELLANSPPSLRLCFWRCIIGTCFRSSVGTPFAPVGTVVGPVQ
jgi:hypothetical protein